MILSTVKSTSVYIHVDKFIILFIVLMMVLIILPLQDKKIKSIIHY